MEMGIPHATNLTISQLNHLYGIHLSDGGAVWFHALRKYFSHLEWFFSLLPSLFLTQRFKGCDGGDWSYQTSHDLSGQSLSLLFSYLTPGWDKGTAVEMPCPFQFSIKGDVLCLWVPLDFCPLPTAPKSSPPIKPHSEKDLIWARGEKKWGVESDYWSPKPDAYIYKPCPLGPINVIFLCLSFLFYQIRTRPIVPFHRVDVRTQCVFEMPGTW